MDSVCFFFPLTLEKIELIKSMRKNFQSNLILISFCGSQSLFIFLFLSTSSDQWKPFADQDNGSCKILVNSLIFYMLYKTNAPVLCPSNGHNFSRFFYLYKISIFYSFLFSIFWALMKYLHNWCHVGFIHWLPFDKKYVSMAHFPFHLYIVPRAIPLLYILFEAHNWT